MTHTSEPWGVLNVPIANRKCRKKLGPLIIASGSDADILRAQSCVNGCAGLNPEAYREVVEALEWYAEQAADCPKLSAPGEVARNNLDRDRGTRAIAALAKARAV